MSDSRLSFGPFQIDLAAQIVLRNGEPLAVGARGVRLLEVLVRRSGEVVTKAALMDAAWPDTAVEESNLSVQMGALRKALGEQSDGGNWIATIPRVGYRFVGNHEAPPIHSPQAVRPSIAVLPFANLSSDPEQAFFADALAEEIIVALGKLRSILVIARSSSFAYRGSGNDLRDAAHDLSVRYVLTGSVRRGGARLRVNVELADGETGEQLWAETYDREPTDVFAIQDEITHRVIAAIAPQVARDSFDAAPGTTNLEALELYMRGKALVNAPMPSRGGIESGIRALTDAIALDPSYVDPLIFIAIGHATAFANGWTDDRAAEIAAGREAADRAIAMAPSNGEAHAARSLFAMMDKDHELLGRESETAVRLSPDGSVANILHGGYLVNDGRPLLSLRYYEHALRVDPGMAHLFFHHLGTAYLFAGRYEMAAALFRSRIELAPATDMSRAYLCAALGHLGQHDEAHRVWMELMAIRPDYVLRERLSQTHYRNAADPERLIEGLRKVGLPA
jgi:TolB-like protein/tetratricopeptide (TPR) repeat protein